VHLLSPPQGLSRNFTKNKNMKLAFPPRMALVALFTLTSAAQAAPVAGAVNFSSAAGGGIILQDSGGNVTTDLAAATGVQSWTLAQVDEGSGSFNSVPDGSAVIFAQPWIFNPSTPESPLWTIAGPDNFTFNLATSTIVFQSGFFLAIEGTGTLTGTSFDPTPGTWLFTTQGVAAQSKFSWSSTSVSVADGSTTLALLSGSLLGLCGLRHKLSRRRSHS
jgi:hypothetical protein